MSDQTPCPICGAAAETGSLVSDVLQWMQCDPDSWQGLLTLGGRVGTITPNGQTILTGIRCKGCKRFMLEDSTPAT